MSGSATVLLSTLLFHLIIVSAVLLAMKYAFDGAYLPAGTLVLTLAMFAYLLFGEARWLE